MFKKVQNRIICCITILGILQFILLTSVAAYAYPGGYNYFGYYFSDLGTSFAKNGEKNDLAAGIFFITLTINAIMFIPFWYILQSLYNATKEEKKYASCGSIFGYLAVPIEIAVGIVPMDTQPSIHIFLAILLFILLAIAILLFSIASNQTQKYSKGFMPVLLFLFLVILIFIIDPNMSIGPLIQKIAVFAFMIWILTQIYYIWNFRE